LLFGLFGTGMALFDPLSQAALPVGLCAPIIHLGQFGITLMDGDYRAFGQQIKFTIGDDSGDFEDVVLLGVKAGHFQIQPNQPLRVRRHIQAAPIMDACLHPHKNDDCRTQPLALAFLLMLTLCFVACLMASLATHAWLALRQIRHVAHHRNQVPPAFAGQISLHSHQRAADYTHAKLQLGLLEACVGAVLLIALTLLGGLQWLDIQLARLIRPEHDLLRQMALVVCVMFISLVVNLPFTLWRHFRLEARFGFNRMTGRLFAVDMSKGMLLGSMLGVPLLALILWVMDNTGQAWAWWAWGIWTAFNLLVLWLFPTVIAPLFNRFAPLQDETLATRVRNLAQRCGFDLNGVFVMDGSKRSAHGNAYFTGFGKAKRIVFFDTLLARLKPDEIEAVLAHELGHFKHRHILKRIVVSLLLSCVFLQGLAWLAQQSWFYTELGVVPQLGRSNSALALILFFLVVPVFTFWVTPLAAWFSRRDEFQADEYAASQSSAPALVSALVRLYDDNAATLTPDPLYSNWHDSHPPAMVRIAHLQGLQAPPIQAA